MKFFSHKQKKHELKTESEEDLSVEDIIAEYQAREDVEAQESPEPDGRGEYYSSSQGGYDGYYDSQSFEPDRDYPQNDYDYQDEDLHIPSSQEDIDRLFDEIFAGYYDSSQSYDYGSDGEDSPAPAHEAEADYGAGESPYGGYGSRSGNIGAIEREAREYISNMQLSQEEPRRAPLSQEELYAPLREDELARTKAPSRSPSNQEIDSRFNLGGRKNAQGYRFGDRSVDMSADSDYSPSAQTDYNLSHWAPEYDASAQDGEDDYGQDEGGRGIFKKRRKAKKSAKEQEPEGYSSQYETSDIQEEEDEEDYSSGFRDHRAAPGDYALEDDYYEDSVSDRRSRLDEDFDETGDLPSFREYLASIFASAFLRIRGTNRNVTTSTMSDSEEELGPELTAAGACRYYGSFMRSQKLRLRIGFGLELLLCYISLGLPVPGMLQTLPVKAAACCAIQFAIMLLALDVVTTAILGDFRLRFGADFLALLSCLVTTADALIVALSDSAVQHTPLCAVSCLSLLGVLLSSSLSTRGIRKSLRVPAIGKNFYSITGETKLRKNELTLLKSQRPAKGFVRRIEEAPPDETLFIKAGPFLIIFAFILSLVLTLLKKSVSDFVFIFSAILSLAAPFSALLAFALPFFVGAMRIFRSGAAIAGWSGLCDIGASRNIIVTDWDLFPESSIEMDTVRIFSDESTEKVVSYAATLVSASGSSIAASFVKLMEETGGTLRRADNFEFLSGGGLKGIIEGHVVLCGSMELMRLMNIRIPYRLADKTSVLLAIDGILYGIFTLKYTPLPQVRRALVELVRSGRHPVFALRDFNVNPEMLHNTFDIATDGYDFPPYTERFAMSEPSHKDSKIAAVVCNEGLGPVTQVADVGRSMYLATRFNLLLSFISALLGPVLVFVKLLTAGSVSIGFLLLFMLAWAVPAVISSLYVSTKS